MLFEMGGDRRTAAGLELSIERVELCLGCIEIEAKRLGRPSAKQLDVLLEHIVVRCMLRSTAAETVARIAKIVDPVGGETIAENLDDLIIRECGLSEAK